MKHSSIPRILIGFCLGTSVSLACIQTMRVERPKDPRQLPADIFKLHLHVDAEPIPLELPLLNGSTATPSTVKPPVDPKASYLELIKKYEADPATPHSFSDRNDYAAPLLFAGRFSDAVSELVKIEADYPGQYSTAANLGTAYELVGELGKAVTWIKTGIARNPQSHDGTEWLHVAILETKQELKRDPNWLARHSVLDGNEAQSRENKEKALEYQLNERLYFIHDKDPVMSDLFYQAALVSADPAKRAYFLRQVPLFSTVRDQQLKTLAQNKR